jgi:hypothetical protein
MCKGRSEGEKILIRKRKEYMFAIDLEQGFCMNKGYNPLSIGSPFCCSPETKVTDEKRRKGYNLVH